MRRGLRVALAVSATAGALVLGAGSAYAGTDPDGGGGSSDDNDHHSSHHDKKVDCSLKVDKDPPAKESDFPSDNHFLAFQNTTAKDAKDAHGQPYYLHNKFCQGYANWRDWDDDSYKTFHFKQDKATGFPSRDYDKNTYEDNHNGYNKQFRKDKKKDIEPDHIGAPKNPTSATE